VSLQRSPRFPSWFKGCLLLRERGEEGGRGGERGEGKERGGEREGREGDATNAISWIRPWSRIHAKDKQQYPVYLQHMFNVLKVQDFFCNIVHFTFNYIHSLGGCLHVKLKHACNCPKLPKTVLDGFGKLLVIACYSHASFRHSDSVWLGL